MAILTNLSVPTESGNRITLMPKLQNRFRVTFVFEFGEIITGNVMSVTKPQITFDEVTLEAYNSRIYIPGKHSWNPVSIMFRDDISSTAIFALDKQVNQQIDMASQSAARAASAFKFRTKIETLDGTNGEPIAGNSSPVLDVWELSGCHVQSVEYGNNDYSSSEPVQVTLSLRYDNAAHTINGVDMLSGQFRQSSQINSTGS